MTKKSGKRGGSRPTPVVRAQKVTRAPRATRRSQYVSSRSMGFGQEWLDSGTPYGMDQPGGHGNLTPNDNLSGFPTMVRRMRDLESFVPVFKGAIDIYVDEALGKDGVIPNFEKWPALQELFKWWMSECDFDEAHPLDLLGKEEQVIRMGRRDGQLIIRHIHQTDLSRVPMSGVPYQFQLMQIDHLPSWYSMPLQNGGFIHGGRQFSPEGKLEGYWMFPVHPNDFQLQHRTNKFPVPIFVNAAEITIPREIGEPGSAVTTPPMRTAAPAMRETHEMMDAAAIQMRNNANTGLLISAPGFSDDEENLEGMYGATGPGGEGGPGHRPGPNANVPFDVDPMEPGGAVIVPPGWKVEQSKPGEVGATFGEFLRRTWGAAAIGTGTPYGRFADDYGSYSSDRIAKIADRDFDVRTSRYRKTFVVRQTLRPIIKRFAIAAFYSGKWRPKLGTDMREVYMCDMVNPRRGNVHELQGEQAAELAVKNGFESRDDVTAKRGKKASQIDFENAVAQERKRQLGQVYISPTGEMTAYPEPPDTPIGKKITAFAAKILEQEAFAFEGSTRINVEIKPEEQVAGEDELTNTFDSGDGTNIDGYYVFGTIGSVSPV